MIPSDANSKTQVMENSRRQVTRLPEQINFNEKMREREMVGEESVGGRDNIYRLFFKNLKKH